MGVQNVRGVIIITDMKLSFIAFAEISFTFSFLFILKSGSSNVCVQCWPLIRYWAWAHRLLKWARAHKNYLGLGLTRLWNELTRKNIFWAHNYHFGLGRARKSFFALTNIILGSGSSCPKHTSSWSHTYSAWIPGVWQFQGWQCVFHGYESFRGTKIQGIQKFFRLLKFQGYKVSTKSQMRP